MDRKTKQKFDAILLLGLRLKADGTAEEEMVNRAKRAAQVYLEGYADTIIACGGRTQAGCPTEAEVLKNELIAFGVDEKAVILEDKSVITVENIVNARMFIGNGRVRAALVTSDYHGFRAAVICRMNGIRPRRFDAPTPDGPDKRDKKRLERLYLIDLLLGYQGTNKKRPKVIQWARRKIADPIYKRLGRK